MFEIRKKEDGEFEVIGTKTGRIFCAGNEDFCKQYVRNGRARRRHIREVMLHCGGLTKGHGDLGGLGVK